MWFGCGLGVFWVWFEYVCFIDVLINNRLKLMRHFGVRSVYYVHCITLEMDFRSKSKVYNMYLYFLTTKYL